MRVAVFRWQLFKPSEMFVSDQTRFLPTASRLLFGGKFLGPTIEGLDHFAPSSMNIKHQLQFLLLGSNSEIERKLNEFKPDLIHAHFGLDSLMILPIAKKLGVPLVTTFHGFDISTSRFGLIRSGKPVYINYALFQNKLKRSGALFICVSDYIKSLAIKSGYPENKLVTHYMGVDPDMFSLAEPCEEKLSILHIARLVEKKGTKYLIEAFAKLVKKYPQATLTIIGDGPLSESLQILAAPYSDQITFTGAIPRSKVIEYLKLANVFVLPSVTAANGDSEGLPTVILEAYASGVPVIGTYHSGIPEAVVEGETGYLVPERDVNALAGALDALLADENLRKRFSQSGVALVQNRFDIRKQSASLEKHYLSVLV